MIAIYLSDIHVPRHDAALLASAEKLLDDVRPDWAIFGGDLSDMAPLGRFDPEEDDPAGVLGEVTTVAALVRRTKAVNKAILPGNHESRWRKAVVGRNARTLRGLLDGLSLRHAYLKAGLPKSVRWVEERVGHPGLILGRGDGRVLFRHGDRQAGRFQAVNLALLALRRDPGMSQVFGHHHRAQMDTQSSLGRHFWAVANPCMARPMNYSNGGDPHWQRGLTVVEWIRGQPLPTIILARPDGSFRFGGKEYRP